MVEAMKPINLCYLSLLSSLIAIYLVGDYSGLSYSLPTTLKTQAFPGTGYTPLKTVTYHPKRINSQPLAAMSIECHM